MHYLSPCNSLGHCESLLQLVVLRLQEGNTWQPFAIASHLGSMLAAVCYSLVQALSRSLCVQDVAAVVAAITAEDREGKKQKISLIDQTFGVRL